MKKIILLFILTFSLFGERIVRIRHSDYSGHPAYNYFIDLLKLSLEKTKDEYGDYRIQIVNEALTQGRSIYELENGRTIDVDWFGTNLEREEKLLPVRIPLFGGLLGYRTLIINQSDKKIFENIHKIEDLKNLIAIQGTHWPDSDILESSGFLVEKIPKFELMFDMLKMHRVDYFPRAITEAYGEIKSVGINELTVYPNIIIEYKFPMYFFFNKNNVELAARVEKGLLMAINDGSFKRLLMNHEATKGAFPLSKFKNSKIFHIKNRYLPKETPLDDKSLWIDLKEFKH